MKRFSISQSIWIMTVKKSKGGRPSKYLKRYALEALKLCQLGATDSDLADFFSVSEKTINTWKKKHSEFLQSLKSGKNEFDQKVEIALAQRAIGYSHPDEKIFNNQGEILRAQTTKHYPPDTTACIYWLKNRKPKQWRDKVEQEQSGEMNINVIRVRYDDKK